MKLGKALATGVAEEQPVVREEKPQVPRETVRTDAAGPAGPVREEVPAAR
ncbi:hypothetical protein ACWC4J_08140 [Streptomyces sp. NPDC001356]